MWGTQLLPAKVMRGLPFVSKYIDDVLIHSTDDEMHAKHLNEVFLRLRKAGLTLQDKKCVIGTPQVTYLGHLFTGSGVTPDREKVKAVEEWPIPEMQQKYASSWGWHRTIADSFKTLRMWQRHSIIPKRCCVQLEQ